MQRKRKVNDDRGSLAAAVAPMVFSIGELSSPVVVRRGERPAARSGILEMLLLGAATGDVIEVAAAGEDEELAIAAITSLVIDGFGGHRGN